SLGVFKSTDEGATWEKLPGVSDYCTTTCGYNSVIAVDPRDANVVFLGGVILRRSRDGGRTWEDLTRSTGTVFLPNGQHALAFPTDRSTMYAGNDGGVYRGTDRTAANMDWANLNRGLAIAEFTTRVTIHPSDPNVVFGGVQRNGIERLEDGVNWR